MYLVYLDDSGSVSNASDSHIILAGVAVPERVPYWLGNKLESLAREAWPDAGDGPEFRGADIIGGKKHWRGLSKDIRHSYYRRALRLLADHREIRIFAAAIHKQSTDIDPMNVAFEQVVSRFDQMLTRMHRRRDTQRGLIILDKSSYETSLQTLATTYRNEGHTWGRLQNIAEVPLFVDSRATRMIQFADLVAYSVRRYVQQGNSDLFDIYSSRIDSEGGQLHGMIHSTPQGQDCNCFSCKHRPRRA